MVRKIFPVLILLVFFILANKKAFAEAYFPKPTTNNVEVVPEASQIIVQYENGKSPQEISEKIIERQSIAETPFIGPARIALDNSILKATGQQTPEEIYSEYKIVKKETNTISSKKLLKFSPQENTLADSAEIVTLEKNVSVNDAIKAYESLPTVVYAEKNIIMSTNTTPNDPYFQQQWALQKIQAPTAWNSTTGNNSVIVAVIDSGVDYTHPDLEGNVIKGSDFINNDSDPNDTCGHGTHVSGIIGALTNNGLGVSGTNWNVKILAVKSMGITSSGDCISSGASILNGIYYAADNGAKIINMSIGGNSSCNNSYIQAINYAKQKGALVIVAAGNENTDASFSAPANCPGVISVGATGPNDERANYSNYGNSVTLSAPGGNKLPGGSCSTNNCIISTYVKNGQQGYLSAAGTSMAAPYVAGSAAILLSKNPNLNSDQIKNILLSTADQITTDKPIGPRINLAKAVSQLSGSSSPSPTNSEQPTSPIPSVCDPDNYNASINKIDFADLRLIRRELAGLLTTNKGSCLTTPSNDSTNFSDLRRARRIIAGLESLN